MSQNFLSLDSALILGYNPIWIKLSAFPFFLAKTFFLVSEIALELSLL